MSEIDYDPYDYAIDADPHPVWRRMRDEAPLYRNEEHEPSCASYEIEITNGEGW